MTIVRGDIFDADLAPTDGRVQAGLRPVIVLSRDAINRFSEVIVIVPLTGAENKKQQYPSHARITATEMNGLRKDSIALGEQIRAINKFKLKRRRGKLDNSDILRVEEAVRITLDMD